MVVLLSLQRGFVQLYNARAEVVNQLQLSNGLRIAASWTAEFYP